MVPILGFEPRLRANRALRRYKLRVLPLHYAGLSREFPDTKPSLVVETRILENLSGFLP